MGAAGVPMTPFYDHAGITVYCGDCRDVLPTLADKSVDHVITDPPYSDVTHNGARTGDVTQSLLRGAFDCITADELRAIFAAAAPKRWTVAFADWRHVAQLETAPPAGLDFIRFGVWIKPNGAPQFTGDRPATGWEAVGIWHRSGEKKRWNRGGHPAVWTRNKENGPHPTTKPLGLVTDIVASFTDPGDLILDPFGGSGTTARACKDLGRRCIVIERERKYCEVIVRRLRQEVLAIGGAA